MTLGIEKVTSENSSQFGTYIQIRDAQPAYKGEDFSFFKNLGVVPFSEDTGFSVVETYMDQTAEISGLERHKDSCEIIIPSDQNIILILGTGADCPDTDSLKALEIEVGTAFVVNKNVWHCAPISTGAKTNVFILLNQNTPDTDLDIVETESISIRS